MRLIDADAMIKYLQEFRCNDCDKRKGMKNGKMRFCYEIGDAPCRACDIGDTIDYFLDEDISPTIDTVVVIRCRDCKHYCYYGLSADTFSECKKNHCENPDENWFCADGERR